MILTLEANNGKELAEKIADLAAMVGLKLSVDPSQMELPLNSVPPTGVLPIDTPTTPRKAGRPKKTANSDVEPKAIEKVEVASVENEDKSTPVRDTLATSTSAASETPQSDVTKEQVIQALSEVHEKKGLPMAREILAQAGVSRVSEMKPEKYSAFVNVCRAIVG